jgi:hypothetical protein
MFQQPAEDRLRSWREFRSSLDQLTLEQALAQTAEFWARTPFAPYYLDPEDNSNWPDPWALVVENTYCDVAKCLGIVYTMFLCQHKPLIDVEMRLYNDPATGYDYNLAWFNQGKYILNMVDGEVVNNTQVEKTLKLKQRFTAVDLKLENY